MQPGVTYPSEPVSSSIKWGDNYLCAWATKAIKNICKVPRIGPTQKKYCPRKAKPWTRGELSCTLCTHKYPVRVPLIGSKLSGT